MSRWRIIGKRRDTERGSRKCIAWEFAYTPRLSRIDSYPFLLSRSPFFFPSLLLSLSLSLCPHRGARSRLAPFVSFVSLFGSARVISAQEAFDLRFCGERAIKKCRENNIATVKSVALNPPGAGLANCPFVPRFLFVFLLAHASSLLRPPLALCRLSNATVNAGLYRFAGFDGEYAYGDTRAGRRDALEDLRD